MQTWNQLRNTRCVQVPIFKLNYLSNALHRALLVILALPLLGGNSTRAYKTLLEALKIPGQSLFVIQRMLILLFVFPLKLEINMAFCLFVPSASLSAHLRIAFC